MAKFYEITGYFLGCAQTPVKRFFNVDHIVKIEASTLNEAESEILLSNHSVLVVKMAAGRLIEKISQTATN
jgi:hypothetical protein